MYTLSHGGCVFVKLSTRVLRCVGLLLLSIGLVAATAIDADGDVATTNLPCVVLPGTRGLPAVDDSEIGARASDVTTCERKSAVLVRRLRRLFESLGVAGQLHHAVRSIRGP